MVQSLISCYSLAGKESYYRSSQLIVNAIKSYQRKNTSNVVRIGQNSQTPDLSSPIGRLLRCMDDLLGSLQPIEYLPILERCLRTVLRVINDRVNLLHNTKDDKSTLIAICDLSQEIDTISSRLTAFRAILVARVSALCADNPCDIGCDVEILEVLNNFTLNLQLSRVINYLFEVEETILKRLLSRVDRVVKLVCSKAVTELMLKYFEANPYEFLAFRTRKIERMRKNLQFTRTKAFKTANIVKTDDTGNLPDDSESSGNVSVSVKHRSKTAKLPSEKRIFNMIETHALGSFCRTVPQLCQAQTAKRVISVGINSALNSFLCSIVSTGSLFDESGVYKLYRVLLQFQEFVYLLKKELQITSQESLIQDKLVWRKAEDILQELNKAVFSDHPSLQSDSGDARAYSSGRRRFSFWLCTRIEIVQSNEIEHKKGNSVSVPKLGDVQSINRDGEVDSTTIDAILSQPVISPRRMKASGVSTGIPSVISTINSRTSDVLSLDEQVAWIKLATNKYSKNNWRILFDSKYWRKKHRGTVFVTLQLNMADL